MKKTQTSTGLKVLLNVLLVIYAIFALFPLVWMVLLSFKSDAQMYNTMFVFSPTLDNYRQVLFKTDYPRYMRDSLIVSGLAVVVSVVGIVAIAVVI